MVPRPADTCSQDDAGSPGREAAGMPVQALGAGRLEVAVGGQRADARQAHLAAVGVAGQHRVVPVGGELVEHPQVRRVRDAEPQVGVRVGRAGDRRRAGRSRGAGRRRRRTRSDVPPTSSGRGGWSGRASRRRSKPARRSRPGQLRRVRCGACRRRAAGSATGCAASARSSRWSRRRRRPGTSSSVAEAVEHDRHRVAVGQVVAGVDDQVGLQGGEAAQPLLLAASGRASGAGR